jgi:hypothetical protein
MQKLWDDWSKGKVVKVNIDKMATKTRLNKKILKKEEISLLSKLILLFLRMTNKEIMKVIFLKKGI